MKGKGAREPVWIDVNQPSFLPTFLEDVEPSLLARKGALHLLCTQDVEEAAVAAVYERYYSDTSFDTFSSLRGALSTACLEYEGAREAILAAVVARNLSAFVLAAQETVVWLERFGEVREILNAPRTKRFSLGPDEAEGGDGETELRVARCHLGVGDTLLFTTRPAIKEGGARKLRRLLRGKRSPQAIVRAAGRRTQPAAIIAMPGLSPVPAMESESVQSMPKPKRTPMALRRRRWSPIWPALFVALVSVALVFWLKKPAVSREELSGLVSWALTPVATSVTSPTPEGGTAVAQSVGTPSPTLASAVESAAASGTREAAATPTLMAAYPPIKLLQPVPDEEIYSRELTFRWGWDGELRENEYFEVRLWRLGEEEKRIAWTKERECIEEMPGRGWYSWQVRLVRGREGAVEKVLKQTEAADFDWTASSEGESEATLAPPSLPEGAFAVHDKDAATH